MIRYLLDTNVISQTGKPKPNANVLSWLDAVDDHELAISAVTLHELAYGVAKASAENHPAAAALMAGMNAIEAAYQGRILPIDSASAKIWGGLLAIQNKHVNDKAQASIAKANGLVLVTRNTKDLQGLDVALLDPFKKPAKLYPA